MRMLIVVILGLLAACSTVTQLAIAEQIYLEADFNDKTIDQAIGIGGAEVGEPFDVAEAITAIVRNGPMGSPSLEIQDIHLHAGNAAFHFLEDAEITSGTVVVAFDLWFDSMAEGDSCKVDVREHGGNQSQFAELIFTDNGEVRLDYGGTHAGRIGTFLIGERFRVVLEFDMNPLNRSFDVWLNKVLVEEDLDHGINDRGIGRVRFGTLFDADSDGRFFVDAIKVSDTFEAVAIEEQSWGRIKTRFR